MAKIITIPNPILREKAKEVKIDKQTLDLVATLKQTLKDTEGKTQGVGLASPQIGNLKRIFVVYSQASKKLLTFINPEITWTSKRQTSAKDKKYEGCLSVPNKWAIVRRPKAIKIKYQTESGQTQVKKFTDLTAKIIQHEYDHLEGILFLDRALEQNQKIYELVKDENGKEFLQEINIR